MSGRAGRGRKERRRRKDEGQTRAKEQEPTFFTIHEVDSDDWHAVYSDEVGFEDALSLHGGNSGDDLSEQGEENVAGRHDNVAEAFLLKKGTKAQKRNMALTQRFRQSKEMPAVEQVGLELGELRLICTQNELHYLGTEEHHPIVEAVRRRLRECRPCRRSGGRRTRNRTRACLTSPLRRLRNRNRRARRRRPRRWRPPCAD